MSHKLYTFLSFALLIAIGFSSCNKPQPDISSFNITEENVTTGTNSVSITGTYSYEGDIQAMSLLLSQNNNLSEADADSYEILLEGNDFSVTVSSLNPGTKYYYCYSVDYNASSPHLTESKSFTTSTVTLTVNTAEVTNITHNSAMCGGNVTSNGSMSLTAKGVCWSTSHNPTIDNSFTNNGTTTGNFISEMTDLQPNTTYYVRAYATSNGETSYGDEREFHTLESPGVPTVETLSVSDVTTNSVNVHGNVTSTGGLPVMERGVCWSTQINPTINDDSEPAESAEIGEFNVTITDLEPNTTYYVRCYATNQLGTAYGENLTFNTSNGTFSIVINGVDGTIVTYTVTSENLTITEHGICWSTLASPSISGNHLSGGSGTGIFHLELPDLDPGTTYYTRAYAINDEGTYYSNEIFFSTTATLPVVTTIEVTDITQTTAIGGGNVTNDGGATVTQRGVCWSTSPNPTTNNSHTTNGTGTGSFSSNLTDLTAGTNYYVRAYATNSAGTTYGDEVNFTTTPNDPQSYIINVSASPSNGGTVSGGGTYQQGQSCTIHATANTGYTFTNWTENGTVVSTNASYTFTVTGNRNLVAQFEQKQYIIDVIIVPEGGGIVQGTGTYNYGQTCTLHATANSGYAFTHWTENGNIISTNATWIITVTGDRTLEAHFTEQTHSYTINVSANPSNGGTVSGGGTYNHGQSCTVHANAASGYTFTNWTENGNVVSTNANYTFTVTGNRTLVANFSTQTHTISVSANPSNGGSVSGGGTYNHGQSCTVHATANTGYTFTNWTENGNVVSTNPNYTFTVTSNHTLVANFTPQTYTINVSANPSNGGSVSGGGTYSYNQSCTVHATANSGYTFTNWTENGNVVSTNANYTFTVTGNRTLVAHFTVQVQTYTINVSANPSNGGTVSGGGTYQQGQSCTVHAQANSGYTFTNWTENGTVVSTNANYTFTVTGNRTLVAHFTVQVQTYTINVSANPSYGGTVTGGGNYQQGQSCTVNAIAAVNYTFSRWTENGNPVSYSANYTFTVTSNRTLVAIFNYNGGGGPTGTINGLFTINASGNQVYFSQGNLQYKALNNTWQFAANQYDYIGSDNSNISSSYSGWIDLFGWGTSGWNCGNTYYHPWDSNNSSTSYSLYGPPHPNDLTGSYANSDWGVYNNIINGGNSAWRTLTKDEWDYVFNGRSTSNRYAKAKVNNVNGVILLPDNWNTSIYSLSNINNPSAQYQGNNISASQWSTLQNAGAVFLPAGGFRLGTDIHNVNSYGTYWTAQHSLTDNQAYGVLIKNDNITTIGAASPKSNGRAVRLVCPAGN
jgi:hypothetical protein